MTFGERLIELRKERGFNNRSEFADYIGMPSTTLRNYETNVREPGHVFLKQMADIFHVSIDYLLCMTDDRTPYKEKASFSKKELDHIEKYRSLDPTGQKHVDTVLQWEVDHMNLLEKKDKTIYDLKHQPDKYPHKIYDLGNIVSMVSESSTPYGSVNAAHDNGATPDQAAAADAIMKDDNEWE